MNVAYLEVLVWIWGNPGFRFAPSRLRYWHVAAIDWVLGATVGAIGSVGLASVVATIAFALTPQDGT
jgi:hypothetical protein